MPSSVCCTNCRTKYSLLNREAGCSSCALSFCKKCLGYRAMLPHLASEPVSVCYDCYRRFEEGKIKQPTTSSSARSRDSSDAQISSSPLPSSSSNSSDNRSSPIPSGNSNNQSQPAKNWWGEGLPPPSMRQQYAGTASGREQGVRHGYSHGMEQRQKPVENSDPATEQIERRAKQLFQKDEHHPARVPEVDELERRLAALRECDVELIRNPRSYFTNKNTEDEPRGDTVQSILAEAKDRARLEEKHDPVKEVERRWREYNEGGEKKLEDNGEASTRPDSLASFVSSTRFSDSSTVQDSAFSTATKEELEDINRLLGDAKKKAAQAEERSRDEKETERKVVGEMRELMKANRTKSHELEKLNNEISGKIGAFWERHMTKESDSSSDTEVDDETVKKIIHEAEQTVDESKNNSRGNGKEQGNEGGREGRMRTDSDGGSSQGSPKKKAGFFGKIFGKK